METTAIIQWLFLKICSSFPDLKDTSVLQRKTTGERADLCQIPHGVQSLGHSDLNESLLVWLWLTLVVPPGGKISKLQLWCQPMGVLWLWKCFCFQWLSKSFNILSVFQVYLGLRFGPNNCWPVLHNIYQAPLPSSCILSGRYWQKPFQTISRVREFSCKLRVSRLFQSFHNGEWTYPSPMAIHHCFLS